MKIQHSFKGQSDYCAQCLAPRKLHQEYHPRKHKTHYSTTYLGIDGEGQTDHYGPWPGKHRYIMLCAADEFGRKYIVENPKGLSSIECLDFIVELPHDENTKV